MEGLVRTRGALHETAFFLVLSDPDDPPVTAWHGTADAWSYDSDDHRDDLVRSCIYFAGTDTIAYVSIRLQGPGYDERYDQPDGTYTIAKPGAPGEAFVHTGPVPQSLRDRCKAYIETHPPALMALYP